MKKKSRMKQGGKKNDVPNMLLYDTMTSRSSVFTVFRIVLHHHEGRRHGGFDLDLKSMAENTRNQEKLESFDKTEICRDLRNASGTPARER